jgi:solute carrier family 25 oxoglutarate transporter 11
MKVDPKTGKLPYKNLVDCALKTVTREGLLKLWVGFPTFYARVGTHAMTVIFNSNSY